MEETVTKEQLGGHIQTADWKTEKHVPVIECPDTVKAGEIFEVKISIGKEIEHPNTTEHHICWIDLYFQPEGGKFTYQVSNFGFTVHGDSTEGPDKGPVYVHPAVTANLKVNKPGTLYALSYCNIHGLWQSKKEIKLA
ncbi:MAG: class II SORL domain-containing protein [Candidatus Eremiobacteraeota bacterium]|nr:class II SORL domain-containing protein [Candidatus Eremiobacteraeota bacterium]